MTNTSKVCNSNLSAILVLLDPANKVKGCQMATRTNFIKAHIEKPHFENAKFYCFHGNVH